MRGGGGRVGHQEVVAEGRTLGLSQEARGTPDLQ